MPVQLLTDFSIWWNGTSKSLATFFGGATRLTVTRRVRELTQWTLDLEDDAAEFDPKHPTSGWQDWLRPTPYPDAAGNYLKKAILKVTLGGVECPLAIGPILGRQQRGSSRMEDGWRHPLRGTDMGHKLVPGGKNVQTQISGYGNVATNHTVLTALLQAAKLEMDLSRLTVMPVPRWDLQNKSLLQGVQEMMDSCGGDWIIRGETFQAWDPIIKAKEHADWTYDLAVHPVREVTHDETALTIHNFITVVRSRDLDNQLAVAKGSGIGQKSVSFSKPAVVATITRMQQMGGTLSDFYFTDAQGNIVFYQNLRGPTPPVTGSYPVTGCTFTFGQASGLDTGDYFEVEFSGRGEDDPTLSLAGFDRELSKKFRYEGSIEKYGEQPFEIFDHHLPNVSWMRNRADRDYYRNLGQAERRSWQVPFNPLLDAGHTVRLKYPETGEDLALYVEQAEHSVGLRPSDRSTTFTGVQYR